MRSVLDHLRAKKQCELERVVQIVFEEFNHARTLARREWNKAGRILKISLYGSCARGGRVDGSHTAKGYQPDYDLLIGVNANRLTDRVKYCSTVDERLRDSFA